MAASVTDQTIATNYVFGDALVEHLDKFFPQSPPVLLSARGRIPAILWLEFMAWQNTEGEWIKDIDPHYSISPVTQWDYPGVRLAEYAPGRYVALQHEPASPDESYLVRLRGSRVTIGRLEQGSAKKSDPQQPTPT